MADVLASGVSPKVYNDAFNSRKYLQQYYENSSSKYSERVRHTLKCYHEAFSSLPGNLKVLEFGCGPVMMNVISAATKASEIILSDYTEKNCELLQKWLSEDSDAFDWLPHFQFVVQELEGKDEEEVKKRQDLVRKLVKAVVHCDITQEPPIQSDYDQLYDVVICCLVLEGATHSSEEYAAGISRLGKLVKKGGFLFMYGVENAAGYYTIGDLKLPNVCVSAEFVKKAAEDSGFSEVFIEKLYSHEEQTRIYRFLKAVKQN